MCVRLNVFEWVPLGDERRRFIVLETDAIIHISTLCRLFAGVSASTPRCTLGNDVSQLWLMHNANISC